jgi:hypothetical protein
MNDKFGEKNAIGKDKTPHSAALQILKNDMTLK